MRIFKHAGMFKIITHNPSETKRAIREAIWDKFRYPFSDDLAVGESVIQFSGRIWGLLFNRSLMGLIDEGEIRIEESGNSILIHYFISYMQIGIMWSIISAAAIPFFFICFWDIEPLMILIGPCSLFGALILIIVIGILKFDFLLEKCIGQVNKMIIKCPKVGPR